LYPPGSNVNSQKKQKIRPPFGTGAHRFGASAYPLAGKHSTAPELFVFFHGIQKTPPGLPQRCFQAKYSF